MRTTNAEKMIHARDALAGKWGIAAGATLIWFIVLAATSSVPMLSLFLSGPMILGMSIFTLHISRNKEAHLEQIFDGFKQLSEAFIARLLTLLYIALWSLLFVIPGIVAALSYAMTFFILADDHSVHATEAIQKSKKMMMGHKWELFCLAFRFIGWWILSLLTCGIGFLWLLPYMHVSFAKFYDELKHKTIA